MEKQVWRKVAQQFWQEMYTTLIYIRFKLNALSLKSSEAQSVIFGILLICQLLILFLLLHFFFSPSIAINCTRSELTQY